MTVTERSRHVPHEHIVNLYDADDDLVADLVGHLAAGLLGGETVVIVATPEHRAAITSGLRGRQIDVGDAEREGRFVALDAAETLDSFVIAGVPDRQRFVSVIGSVLTAAAAGGRPVRAFGEMVALLWDAGNVSGAIELESLWNELADQHLFSLYCAYPMATLAESGDLAALHQVCEQHSSLVAPRRYGSQRPASTALDPADQRSELFLPVPLAVRAVRQLVIDALHGWGEAALLDDLTLMASELATNAVAHASCPFRVTLRLSDSMVAIDVEDRSPGLPRELDPPDDAGGGRGILLVAALSSSWGTRAGSDGKVVWAELPRTSSPS